MKAHRKLWESGLYDSQIVGARSGWWLSDRTDNRECRLMRSIQRQPEDIDFTSPEKDGMYALFFALYFADEGEQDTIDV